MSFDSNRLLSSDSSGRLSSNTAFNWNEVTNLSSFDDHLRSMVASGSTHLIADELGTDVVSLFSRHLEIFDVAGDTLETAHEVELTSAPSNFNDFVGILDTNDYYHFTLAQTSNFNLALSGLGTDADVQLFSSNHSLVNWSMKGGTADEAINHTLEAGDYYLQVFAFAGDTNYNLRLSVTPSSTTTPSNLLPLEFDLGQLNAAPISATGALSNGNTTDVYRFASIGGDLDLSLTGLTRDADVRLIWDTNSNGIVDEGEEITRSEQSSSLNESIRLASLATGNYFVQVYQYSGDTSYTLNLATSTTAPPDYAGNTLSDARDLGLLNTQQIFSDFVGAVDSSDYYRFTLDNASQFNLLLADLSADADVQLLNSNGDSIASSTAGGASSESISRALTAGTYYLSVYPYSGNTNYTFNLSATEIVLPPRFSLDYGYGLVDAAAVVAQATGQLPFDAVPDLGGTDWNLDAIHAPEVWARGYTGQGVVVAVVDSGVDYTHPDLDANIWINSREIAGNGVDEDGNGYIDDLYGWDFIDNDNTPTDLSEHGTHVAGTIAAENDGSGATGVAYHAQIMPVRVLDANGSGGNSGVAAGIRYAADTGADVINLSLSGGFSDEIASAVRYATEQGVFVVMASGNEGASQPGFPAALANEFGIAVGAVDSSNRLADFSNRAGLSPLNYVVAPGVNIYSTTPNNTYSSLNGTSMAAPHVVGVAALLLSANPDLTPAQLTSLLTETTNSEGVTV